MKTQDLLSHRGPQCAEAAACEWHEPPQEVALGDDEVHLWRAGLSVSAALMKVLEQTLSAEEQARAGRFAFESHRRNFIVAHGILRAVLGAYLGAEPRALEFSCGPQGKPFLRPGTPDRGLRFNMSHSGDLAVYAIARGRHVGVDVEHVRQDPTLCSIAEQWFSAAEAEAVRSLSGTRQVKMFYHLWTLKEAYLKGTGRGLRSALSDIEIRAASAQGAGGGEARLHPTGAPHWSLQSLRFAPGFAGALAVEGEDWTLRCWQWSDREDEQSQERAADECV